MNEEFSTEEVSIADALQMQIYTTQALIDILVKKGLLSYQDILAAVEALKKEHDLILPGASTQ